MILSPWSECIKGHPTTEKDHFIIRPSGVRECRACAFDKLTDAQRKRLKGDYAGLARLG